MAERHVARCDAPDCGKEVALKVSTGTQSWGATGQSFPTTNYAIPDGWRNLEGATLCSWKCISEYAAQQSAHRDGRTAQ